MANAETAMNIRLAAMRARCDSLFAICCTPKDHQLWWRVQERSFLHYGGDCLITVGSRWDPEMRNAEELLGRPAGIPYAYTNSGKARYHTFHNYETGRFGL